MPGQDRAGSVFAPRTVCRTRPVVANGLVYFPSGGRIYAVAADAYELPGQYQLQLVWAQFWIWQFPVPRPPSQPGGKWRFSPRKPRQVGFSPHRQWPPRRFMSVIPTATFTLGRP